MTKTKIVPTETNDPSATPESDAAQGGAYVEANSKPVANRVEQPTQEEGGSIASTARLPTEENTPGETKEERHTIGSAAPLPAEEESTPSAVNRSPNLSDTATAELQDCLHASPTYNESGGGVLDDAPNASDVSNMVPKPGANKDEVDTGSLLNPINSKPSQSQEGQPLSTVNDEGCNEDEAGRSAQISLTPNFDKDKHGDGDGDGVRTFSLSHPGVDTASLGDADKSPTVLTSGEQESKENSGASPPNTLDTEECDEEDAKPAGGGAVFARRGTGRYIPRPSSDKANDMMLASEKRPSFRVPPAMYMGHPVGSLSAEFLERHERRVKEATVRRESVADLLKLVMNHDPVSSGSPMPDVDVVFPDYHSDQNEGDWFV